MTNDELFQKITTPQATSNFLMNERNLLGHMEAIRQAYWLYGRNDTIQSTALLNNLKKRYMNNQNDPIAYFDYGYAQLVNEGNKNGLFFLRKANDSLASSVTSLAYGLAEIDGDLVFENADRNVVTPRKMDVGYRLTDALTWNKTQKIPGIWPTFVSIRNIIRDYPGFDRFAHEDFSLIYIPNGKVSLAKSGFRLFTNPVIQEAQSKQSVKADRVSNKISQPDTSTSESISSPTPKTVQKIASTKPTNNKPNGIMRFFGIGPKDVTPIPELSPIVKADNLGQVVAGPQYQNKITALPAEEAQHTESNIPWTIQQPQESMSSNIYAPERVELNPQPETNTSAPVNPMNHNNIFLATTAEHTAPAEVSLQQQCEFPDMHLEPKSMKYAVVIQLQGHEPPEAVEFYNTNPEKSPYDVRVLNASKHVIGQFTSSKAPFIMEDLNKDGVYELVVRQYFVDPYHPVIVYNWNGSCYSADTSVKQYFE